MILPYLLISQASLCKRFSVISMLLLEGLAGFFADIIESLLERHGLE